MGNLAQYIDGGLDPSTVEPSNDFTPLPPGWYPVEIEAAEIKATKKGDGQLLKVTMTVLGEQYNGRKLFPQFNIRNQSAKAEQIGRQQLADLARACGIAFLDDEDKLLGKQLEVKVKVKQDEGFEPDNDVKGYRQLGGGGNAATPKATAPAAPQAPAATPPKTETAKPAAAAAGKMPWER